MTVNSKKIPVHLMDVLSFINATWSCINEKICQYQRSNSHGFSLTFEMVRLDGFINIYLVKKQTNKSFL